MQSRSQGCTQQKLQGNTVRSTVKSFSVNICRRFFDPSPFITQSKFATAPQFLNVLNLALTVKFTAKASHHPGVKQATSLRQTQRLRELVCPGKVMSVQDRFLGKKKKESKKLKIIMKPRMKFVLQAIVSSKLQRIILSVLQLEIES